MTILIFEDNRNNFTSYLSLDLNIKRPRQYITKQQTLSLIYFNISILVLI